MNRGWKSIKKTAMTLAEVLITLGIIGVVCAFTIPTLIKNTQDAEFKSALQKEVSVLSQATMQMASDNGGTLQGLFQYTNTSLNVNSLITYIPSLKVCNNNVDTNGCWHKNGNWYAYDGTKNNATNIYLNNGGIILKDGSLLLVSYTASSTCTNAWMDMENSGTRNPEVGIQDCEIIFIDVNGFKGPNRTGKDIFALSLREPGIVYPGVYARGTYTDDGIQCASAVLSGQTCP